MGYRRSKHTQADVFGEGIRASIIDLPCRLENFVSRLPSGANYTVMGLIQKHTVFPYYAPFLDIKTRVLLRGAMAGDAAAKMRVMMGPIKNGFQVPPHIQFCPACLDQTVEQYGRAAWLRAHQLPGVLVCPDHGVPLYRSHVRRSNRLNPFEYIPASPSMEGTAVDIPAGRLEAFHKLACESQRLLAGAYAGCSPTELSLRVQVFLGKSGWVRPGGVAFADLVSALRGWWGDESLRRLGCFPDQATWGKNSWPAPLYRPNPLSPSHPLRYLVLLVFLNVHADEFFGVKVFGVDRELTPQPRPGAPEVVTVTPSLDTPCPNPACQYYSVNFRRAYRKLSTVTNQLSIDCLRCEAAFVWSVRFKERLKTKHTGPLWDELFRKHVVDPHKHISEIAKTFSLSRDAVHQHAIRLDVWREAWGDRPTPNPRTAMFEERLAADRAALLKALRDNPTWGRSQLKRHTHGSYDRIAEHDRPWFERFIPAARKSGKSPIDWASRDKEYLDKAKIIVARALSPGRKPARITLTLIGIEIGKCTTIISRKDRLPHLMKYIREVEESKADYEKRVMQWKSWQESDDRRFLVPNGDGGASTA